MKFLSISLALFLVFKIEGTCNKDVPSSNLIIEGRLSNAKKNATIVIKMQSADFLKAGIDYKQITIKQDKDGGIRWETSINRPVVITAPDLFGITSQVIFEPGDHITILNKNGQQTYSGPGSMNITLTKDVIKRKSYIKMPGSSLYRFVKSLKAYQQWDSCMNMQQMSIKNIWKKYKDKVSPYVLKYVKYNAVANIEKNRQDAFMELYRSTKRTKGDDQILVKAFDKYQINSYSKWLENISERFNFNSYFYHYVQLQVLRQFDFDSTQISNLGMDRKLKYYELGRKLYKGHLFESFFITLITHEGLKEYGYHPQIAKLLDIYYECSTVPEYKEFVKNFEEKTIKKTTAIGKKAQPHSFVTSTGKTISPRDLKGKTIIMNFIGQDEKSGNHISQLEELLAEFKNDSLIQIVHIPPYRDSASRQSFSSENWDNATIAYPVTPYVEKAYYIKSYPQIVIINQQGKILENDLINSDKKDGHRLLQLVRSQAILYSDGPYAFDNNNNCLSIYSFDKKKLVKKSILNKKEATISVNTDQYGKTLTIPINRHNIIPPCEYDMPEKMVVLSDIEGNFNCLRELLQASKVIDEQFNWTFGKGHLILGGDFFDRGLQVTECLWLIYLLEQKAKSAGGYVHFILGNHEIMNMSNNTSYVQQKYIDNAASINVPYNHLYGENTELGKWLRSKNVIEKIGSILFLHGGVSKEVNELDLNIQEINEIARPYYSKSNAATKSNDPNLQILYGGNSPFWFRNYYKLDTKADSIEMVNTINDSLDKFGVDQIITGHTVKSEQVSVHHQGKVINTDTPHAKGYSAALLIEDRKYYNIDRSGKKELIYIFPSSITSN